MTVYRAARAVSTATSREALDRSLSRHLAWSTEELGNRRAALCRSGAPHRSTHHGGYDVRSENRELKERTMLKEERRQDETRTPLDKNLAFELARVTEAAALASARWMGKGDKNAADQAAVNAMRFTLGHLDMDGVVVIG